MNVIFVLADEWRAHAMGYNGDPNVRTPTLDRFERQALNCTAAVAGTPVCCPYRASLLTGQYPLTHGVVINDVPVPTRGPSLARLFTGAGYHTAWIGKWHVYGSPGGKCERRRMPVPRDHQLGFDLFMAGECSHDYWHSHYSVDDDPTLRYWEGYDAIDQTRHACDYLRDPRRRQQPFFLGLSWGPPHFPMQTAPEEYRARFRPADMQLRPNVPAVFADAARTDLAGLSAHTAALDDCFAQVLRTLDDTGLAENTILIFASDHGCQHHSQGVNFKLFPFDESVCVPFLMRLPGQPAARLPIPIDAPDILPTLAGICGLATHRDVQGRDWSRELLGQRSVDENAAALLSAAAQFTALRWHDFPVYRGLRSAAHTYVAKRDGPFLLYDNTADPYQMHNRAHDPAATPLCERLHSQLLARLAAIGDDFPAGDALVARRGLTHYLETQQPIRRKWFDPWAPGAPPIPADAWTFHA